MNYLLHLLIITEIYLMLALSLNLMIGYTGLLTLAHAAFYGIGAYATTLIMIHTGFGFLPALLSAVGIAVALSFLISSAALRFRGDYFVLATLAFQVIVFSILNNWISVTRGTYGIPDIPRPSLLGVEISSLFSFAVLGLGLSIVIAAILALAYHSPFGRTLQAIRDDEIAATSLGKNVISFKMRSVALASACAAVAGALYATYVTFIDPTSFTTEESVLLVSMVVIGGTGNLKGPVVGSVLLVLLPELLRFLAVPDSLAPNLRMIIYGLLLIVIMRFRPQGIAGSYRFE